MAIMNEKEISALEKRMVDLEKKMAEIQAELLKLNHRNDWRQTIGMFTGNELMKRIDSAGQAIRRKERVQAKRRYDKSRQSKK
jgi:hypothetical protein